MNQTVTSVQDYGFHLCDVAAGCGNGHQEKLSREGETMSKRGFLPYPVFLSLLFALSVHAQVIPPTRGIDWTSVGIPGGIPSASWPVYTTINPSGGADDSVAIQTAINNAPAGSVVLLGAGTFTLHRSSTVCYGKNDDYGGGVYESGLCLTDKSVVLRGQGPDKTILNYGDGANIISLGATYLGSSQATSSMIAISSGSTKGSQSITLANVSGIAVGNYVVVTENNPLDTDGNPLASADGYTGTCSYCGHDMPNNLMSEVAKITAISGKTLTIEFPLYFDFTNSPAAYKLPNMVENVGLENLRVVGTGSSGTSLTFKNVDMESCAHCWVHNVESDMAVDKSHMYLSDTYGCEISNNYFNDGFNHNSGATYSVLLEFRNSQDVIENNIIRKARHSTPQSGSSGNVYAYNYQIDAYMGEYPNSLPETQAHGAHVFMNLWEGNTIPNLEWDNAHGSSSHNTLFRNYINLTGTDPSTGSKQSGAVYAIAIAYDANYANVLGNVVGPSGSCTVSSYQIKANGTSADGNQPPAVFKLGYYDDGGTTSPSAALSAKVENTLLRGGNWDCKTAQTIWSSNAPSGTLSASYISQQVLPNSMYLSAKPAWFGSSAWPLIGPDVTTGGVSNVGGHVNKSPAQLCYENGPSTGGAFTPSVCYASNGRAPLPPTNLTSVAR
jgi:hypothetical protein